MAIKDTYLRQTSHEFKTVKGLCEELGIDIADYPQEVSKIYLELVEEKAFRKAVNEGKVIPRNKDLFFISYLFDLDPKIFEIHGYDWDNICSDIRGNILMRKMYENNFYSKGTLGI